MRAGNTPPEIFTHSPCLSIDHLCTSILNPVSQFLQLIGAEVDLGGDLGVMMKHIVKQVLGTAENVASPEREGG